MMQTVLITGSNRGLGYEFVRQYLEQDAKVISCCRQPQTARQLKKLQAKYNHQLLIIPLDVTKQESITQAFDLVQQNFNSLDLLIKYLSFFLMF